MRTIALIAILILSACSEEAPGMGIAPTEDVPESDLAATGDTIADNGTDAAQETTEKPDVFVDAVEDVFEPTDVTDGSPTDIVETQVDTMTDAMDASEDVTADIEVEAEVTETPDTDDAQIEVVGDTAIDEITGDDADTSEGDALEPECNCEYTEKSFCQDGVWSHVYYGCGADGICKILQSGNGLCPPPGVCAGDVCAKPECVSNTDCDDANPCTADVCANGLCTNQALDGLDCDDDNVCTVDDVCLSGACTGAALPDTDDDGACDAIDACDFDAENVDGACAFELMCWGASGCPEPPYYPPVWSYEDWISQPPACENAPGLPSTSHWPTAACCLVEEVVSGSPCFYGKHPGLGFPGGNFDAYEHFSK